MEAPELRILDADLWNAAKQRQGELELIERGQKVRNALNTRPRSLSLVGPAALRAMRRSLHTHR